VRNRACAVWTCFLFCLCLWFAICVDILTEQTCPSKAPAGGSFYHGGDPPPGAEGKWHKDASPKHVVSEDRTLDVYSKLPYASHQDYINDLMDLRFRFASDMRRRDCKGRSVAQILEAGASYKHYGYLRNGGLITATLSEKDRLLLAWGTCGNEALHQQINSSQRTVIQQHVERSEVRLQAFSLGKMVAHSSAAYHPTISQKSQKQLLSVVHGHTMADFFKPFGAAVPEPVTCQTALRQPVHANSDLKTEAFKMVRASQQQRWGTELGIRVLQTAVQRSRVCCSSMG
jgi:hypothetical protein